MPEPIPFTTTRYRCPTCPRTGSSKARVAEHIARCWRSPELRGCKTCKHFEQDPGDPDVGLIGGEDCAVGVDIAGPIVHCDRWEATS